MTHCINLNIHYSAPEEVWKKINDIYSAMPYWNEKDDCPRWIGTDIDLCASVEPSGIQIAGTMPGNIWDEWYDTLKNKLSEALGYSIGEPEDGFKFKYWEPFVKNYEDIKSVDGKGIVFKDYSTFYWEQFEDMERDISAKPPYFVFRSTFIELRIFFDETGLLSKGKNRQNFLDLQAKLTALGLSTRDLS